MKGSQYSRRESCGWGGERTKLCLLIEKGKLDVLSWSCMCHVSAAANGGVGGLTTIGGGVSILVG